MMVNKLLNKNEWKLHSELKVLSDCIVAANTDIDTDNSDILIHFHLKLSNLYLLNISHTGLYLNYELSFILPPESDIYVRDIHC